MNKYVVAGAAVVSISLVALLLWQFSMLNTEIKTLQRSVEDNSLMIESRTMEALEAQAQANASIATQRTISGQSTSRPYQSPVTVPSRPITPPQTDLLKQLPVNTEVHVIGIYEPKVQSINGGEVTVSVTRKNTPVILVLSAYDYTTWNVETAAGTDLRAVVMIGNNGQSTGKIPDGVQVINMPKGQGSYSYSLTNFNKMSVESLTGHKVYSYQGNYRGDRFVVDDDYYKIPHQAFALPSDYHFPSNTKVHVIAAKKGAVSSDKLLDDSFPIADGGSSKVPYQLVTVRLEKDSASGLLVLSAPIPMGWKIENPHQVPISGIILSGPDLQYLVQSPAPVTYPVIMQSIDATAYQGDGYKQLAQYLQTLNPEFSFTSYQVVDDSYQASIDGRDHFPKPGDLKKAAGIVDYPASVQTWNTSGEYAYTVPTQCGVLHAMAWGGGGGGGSWTYNANMGGGGGYAYGKWKQMAGKSLQIIVGGGGKVGNHRTEQTKPSPGLGGFPDGGKGSVGYDATGGGGGGASRIKLDQESILVAGGGGGGCGHGDSMGGGGGGGDAIDAGSSQGIRPSHDGGKGGANGVGGRGGIGQKTHDKYPDIYNSANPGNPGTNTHGGDGGEGLRKGAGGGGGGYGGGGGGATNFHNPGGGGGGGSFGQITKPGVLMSPREAAAQSRLYGNQYVGAPGNAAQVGINGYGGKPTQDGVDGKVMIWCDNQ